MHECALKQKYWIQSGRSHDPRRGPNAVCGYLLLQLTFTPTVLVSFAKGRRLISLERAGALAPEWFRSSSIKLKQSLKSRASSGISHTPHNNELLENISWY